MATYIVFISLLFVIFVLHLPCPLSAIEPGNTEPESFEDLTYNNCYKKCVDLGRFPCPDGSASCGDCLRPLTQESLKSDDACEMVQNNEENVLKILDIINKRDGGTGGVEVDTGTGQDPPPAPPADVQDPPADVGAEGNQANSGTSGQEGGGESDNESGDNYSSDAFQKANADVEIYQAEKNDCDGNNYPSDAFQESNADVEAHQAEKNNGSVILLEEWQFILIVVGCVAVAIIGVAIAFICWYKIQTTSKAQNEADYPSYGVTGPGTQVASTMNNGDRKLAQSAQMYHYQHQKQQMIAMEKREKGDVARDASDYDSEEENEDGDLTVYECPGLAPTGEMQVKNPLFAEDAYPKQGGEEEGEEKQ